MSTCIKLELMGQPLLAERSQGIWRLFEFDPRGEPIPARICVPDYIGVDEIEDFLASLFRPRHGAARLIVRRLA